MKPRTLPHVRSELVRLFLELEDQRPGIGHRLLNELNRALEQVETDALFYPLVEDQPSGGAFREAHLLRSTYRLIFEIRTAEVVVVSLIHTHRRPGAWHSSFGELD